MSSACPRHQDVTSFRNCARARRVQARIGAIIDLLLTHPHLGRRTHDPTIRRASTPPYPYLIFYEIVDDEIVIHAVRHSARDPSDMPGSA